MLVWLDAEMVIELAPLANAIFAPATRDTLEEDALRLKFVAAGTVGPTIVMLLAPLLNVILAPATRLTLLDVPFKLKFVATGTVGPTIVMLDAPVFRVMLAPAARRIDPVLVAPAVPRAAT